MSYGFFSKFKFMAPKIQNKMQKLAGDGDALKLDFIGDVHGYANALENLLLKLGYAHTHDGWVHPTHKAVFVGDFINRGPHNRRTIDIIRTMVDRGHAYAILGNHEINAICYFTRRKSGKPIRMPGPANRKQLDRIKREYLLQPHIFDDLIQWLRHLPLFIDFGTVRVVHAYWSDAHIALLKRSMTDKKLKRKFLKEAMQGGSEVSKAFMQTTKGIEFSFPSEMVVRDNNQYRRINFRVKWWQSSQGKTFEQVSLETKYHLPNQSIPPAAIVHYDVYQMDAPPVFVGHYCMNGFHPIPVPNVCCVDACVAAGGRLAAYRWEGEQHLDVKNMVYADTFNDDDD